MEMEINTITTIKYTSKELAERLEISTKELHDIAISENIGIRHKGKFLFLDPEYSVVVQNEFNGKPIKQYFWSEFGAKAMGYKLKNYID